MSSGRDILQSVAQRMAMLGGEGVPVVHSAPGRLDVIGGLSCEAGGVVGQMALPRRAAVGVQARTDGQLIFIGTGFRAGGIKAGEPATESIVRFPADDLFPLSGRPLPEPHHLMGRIGPEGWWTLPYVGLFYLLSREGIYQTAATGPADSPAPRGAAVVVDSEIAIFAGQGSSTAVTAALLQAVVRLFGFNLSTVEKAVLIHRAESLFGPSGGHVVDALTVLCAADGPPAHLLRYSAQPHNLIGQIPLPADVRVFALNTGKPAMRSSETARSLRLAGDMGLRIMETVYRDLGRESSPLNGYLGNMSPELYRRYFRSLLPRRLRGRDFLRSYGELPQEGGPVAPGELYRVRAAVDHLISEREHAENFLQVMEDLAELPEAGRSVERLENQQRRRTLQRAGRLLLASQHSYRLRLGLSCPQADWLLSRLIEAGPAAGVFGARITASGGGGTVAAMLDNSNRATDALLQIVSDYPREMGLPLEIQAAGAAGSAGATWSGNEPLPLDHVVGPAARSQL